MPDNENTVDRLNAELCDASQFVSQCTEISEAQLKTFLSQHLADVQKYIERQGEDQAEKYIRMITKGLRQKSKQAEALRYYYYGYYIRQQEEQIQRGRKSSEATKTMVLTSKKHYLDILKYLFEHGCSQQKEISGALGVDKSNLNRIMNNLTENELVVKLVGPKCAFFELSSTGYTFVREQQFQERKPKKIRMNTPLENSIERFKKELLESVIYYSAPTSGGFYELERIAHASLDGLLEKKTIGDTQLTKNSLASNGIQDVRVDTSMIKAIIRRKPEQWAKTKNRNIPEIPRELSKVGAR